MSNSVKKNEERPLIVTRGDLLRSMLHRMPNVKFYDMMKYVNIIIQILIDRAVNDRISIIDGFGILYRRKTKPKRVFNSLKDKYFFVVSHSVVLRGNKDFIEMMNNDKEFIKDNIKENSAKEISLRTYKKKII